MVTTFASRILSGIVVAAALVTSGCGGANLARDCTGFSGQYGAPGSASELLANRLVKVYATSNCDSADANANCQELEIKTTRTGNDGVFTINGLTNGEYRVRTYSVDGNTLLETSRVTLPDVCRATPTPSPS